MAPRTEQRVTPATSGQAVSAATATVFDRPTAGVMITSGTTLTCRLANDSADVVLTVIVGVLYPVSLISVPVGNAVAFVALFNVAAP